MLFSLDTLLRFVACVLLCWHHIRAAEGPQCFSFHCHPCRQWGEVRDCVAHWSVLLLETLASVMKLTSPHCLSLELRDAQQDGRENPKFHCHACIFLCWSNLSHPYKVDLKCLPALQQHSHARKLNHKHFAETCKEHFSCLWSAWQATD